MAKKTKSSIDVDSTDDLRELLESDEVDDVQEYVGTGSTLLNYAISNGKNGGIPVGRITELIGENQSGKTLIATHVLSETQKRGGIAILIDTEHDVDKSFSYRVGLNWDGLIYKEWLSSLEEVFSYIEQVIVKTRLKHKDKLITIVWDSIGATPAGVELESGYDPSKLMGVHARIMSMGLRKIRSAIKSERIALLCTNQLRHKIGVSFGDPTTTSHGKAMSFYASVRIKLSRVSQLKDKDGRIVGAACDASVIKNKVGPAWRKVSFPVMYDWGIDDAGSLFDYLYDMNIITGKSYKSIMLGEQEIKFRNSEWTELLQNNLPLRQYVFECISNKMIIDFTRKIESLDIDVDSVLEVEQIKSDLEKESQMEL